MSRLLFFSIILICAGCTQNENAPTLFDTSTDEFILPDGFSIKTIAAESLLSTPVALSFDSKNRIWAAELTGYMRDIDGSDEEIPDGKIVLLEDKNKDGIADKRTVIIDSLQTPRTLLHAYGGLLYNDGASLYWSKLEDKKIFPRILVDSLYVVGGNIEHQPNGLLYHLDNWIYSANSKTRYRLKNGEWLREATTFRGQWGISSDPDGRLFYNNNSLPLATDAVMPNQLISNDFQKVNYANNRAIATSNRLYAHQATSANRGYLEDVLDEEGKIQHFTSACAPTVFTGNALGDDFQQNVFVCAPEANLVKRYILENEGSEQTAVPAYDSTEFIVSTDETFRPINLYNAPDGSFYILDMRKGIIQHRAYMTSYLREQILDKGLDTISGRGRIYSVFNDNIPVIKPVDFHNLSNTEIVGYLSSPLPYQRLFAQQQLVFRNAIDTKKLLEQTALDGTQPYGQLHALRTLEGLDILDYEIWEQLTKQKNTPIVNETLIQFSAFFPEKEQAQIAFFKKSIENKDIQLIQQIASRLGAIKLSVANELLLLLAKNYGNDPIFCEALISGITGKEENLLSEIKGFESTDSLQNFLTTVIENKKAALVLSPQLPKKLFKDNRTAGFELYSVQCAACHGLDGKGKAKLSPPLVDSEYISGSTDRLILLILNGVKGPITVNNKRYNLNAVMPGIKNNPAISDKDITDLVIFLRNSFSFSNPWIREEDVAKWREQTRDKTDMFTEEELKGY